MAYLAGELITDSVLVVDNNNTPVVGTPSAVFTQRTLIGPDSLPRSLNIIAVGNGLYRVTFQTDNPGSYALSLIASTPTGNQTYFSDYDVDAAEASGVAGAAGVAFGADTRSGLRRRIGVLIGEVLVVKCTATGTTTTAIDTRNLVRQDGAFVGRQLWIAAAASSQNVGLTARITANSKSLASITFSPALPAATQTGDIIELWNERDTGPTVEEVHEMMNFHIKSVADKTLSPTLNLLTGSFNASVPVLTLPLTWETFVAAEWQDEMGIWHRIPPADIRVDQTSRTIELRNHSRHVANKRPLRARGATRAIELDSEIATTDVDTEWLVYQTAASLMFSSSHRMLDIGQGERKAQYLQTLADSRRPKTDRVVRGKRLYM